MRYLLLIAAFLVAADYQVHAQCCAAGNPVNVSSDAVGMNSGNLLLSLSDKHSFSDTYYHGTKVNSESFLSQKETYFNFLSLDANYSLTDKVLLNVSFGYFIQKGERLVNRFVAGSDKPFERNLDGGFGDINLGVKYLLFKGKSSKIDLLAGFDLGLPLGEFNAEDEIGVLSIDLQPSTGALRYKPNLTLVKRLNKGFSIIGYGSAEFIGNITMNNGNRYKYGNIYIGSLIGSYSTKKMSFLLQSRYESRDKRTDNDDVVQNSTGGSVLFVSPQVGYNISKDYGLSLSFDYPVYHNMNFLKGGTGQLGNKYIVGFSFKANINTGKDISGIGEDVIMKNEDGTADMNFFVDGTCEMCRKRITDVVNSFSYIKYSDWNPDTKLLTIKYDPEINLDDLYKAIAEAGHDNSKYKASTSNYTALHSCCKYRD